MGRILAIDYGLKRSGIAVTDTMKIIANGLDTVETPKLLHFLNQYCRTEQVEAFVIGVPLGLDDQPAEIHGDVLKFIEKLKRAFPGKPVHEVDERFSSKIAEQTIRQSGLKKKKRQDKGLIDKVSATIILQEFLETHNT
jgi:putative Holliday junction resolvase